MRSLRARLVTTLGLGLALLISCGGVFLYLRVRDTLRGGFDESLRNRAQALASRLEVDLKPAYRARITSLGAKALASDADAAVVAAARAELLRLAQEGFEIRFAWTRGRVTAYTRSERPDYFEIWLPDGTVLARSTSLGTGALGSHEAAAQPGIEALTLPDGRPGRSALVRVEDVGFAQEAWTRAWEQIRGDLSEAATTVFVRVAQDTESEEAWLASLRRSLLAAGVLLLCAVAVLVWFVSSRALAPLRRLRRQVEGLEADSLHQRVALEGVPSELALVVESLNASLARLETGFERERRTASHIAHELRTPIAELRSITDVARQWPDDQELQARCVAQGHEIAAHMSRIVNVLLRVARAGASPTLLSAEVDLAALVQSVWRRLGEAAAAREQQVEIRVPEGLVLAGDSEVMETLLANLLRNAVDHAPTGSTLRCAAEAEVDGTVHIRVSNPCTGLTDEDMLHVAEPFWRKDASRTSSLQGGLGLPLVAEVARSAGLGFALELRDGHFVAHLRVPPAPSASVAGSG